MKDHHSALKTPNFVFLATEDGKNHKKTDKDFFTPQKKEAFFL